jgi:hypothetical protein
MGESEKKVHSDRVEYRDKDGKLHRTDGPAMVRVDGYQAWYEHGLLHRGGGKPAVTYSDGYRVYFEQGELHREGGKPAIVWPDGCKAYFEQGKPHRLNGPAVVYADGRVEYWVDGEWVK